MIEDEVPNRHRSLSAAIYGYARLMARLDRAEEGMTFFREVRPQALAFDGQTLEFNDLLFLRASAEWLPLLETRDARARLWQAAIESTNKSLPSWGEAPGARIWDAVVLDDRDLARTIALEELFTRPVSRNLNIDRMFEAPALAPLAADPDIQAALAQLERRVNTARSEVRELLLQPEWSE